MTRGEKIVAFIEAYCKIPEGAEVGQPIKLINQLKSPNTGPFVLATNLTPVSELPTAAIASIAKDAVSSSGHSVIVRAVLSPVLIKRRFVAPTLLKSWKAIFTCSQKLSGVAGASVSQSVTVASTKGPVLGDFN